MEFSFFVVMYDVLSNTDATLPTGYIGRRKAKFNHDEIAPQSVRRDG
jgi:hypothetical protein